MSNELCIKKVKISLTEKLIFGYKIALAGRFSRRDRALITEKQGERFLIIYYG